MAKKKLSIKDLKPAPYNPRTIKPEAIAGLQNSLDKFGDIAGITWNKRTGNLVAGHQRMESLKRLYGEDKLVFDGVKIVCPDGNEYVVRTVDWDDAMEKAANVTANNTFLQGDFTAGLKDIIVELKESDFPSFDDLCFDDLSKMVSEADTSPIKGLKDDDDIPEVKTEPKTKAGDLYLLGDHRLLCGDATNKTTIERLMDGKKAGMVFTDPPYGMGLDTDYSKVVGSKKSIGVKNGILGNDYQKVIGDNHDFDENTVLGIFEYFQYCKEIFVWGADYFIDLIPNCGKDGTLLVWNKRSSDAQQKAIGNCYELFWSKAKHKKHLFNFEWFGFISKDAPLEVKGRLHPTMKPVGLIESIWSEYNSPNGIVVDIFGGSGSTLIACEKTKRKCYMMEIDPHYCDVIVKRWEDFTGKKAISTASK